MRLSPVVQSLTEPLLSPLVSAITGASGSGFSPTSLFADGAKGVVYDNNDFVDSATWRRNLLTYTEQFDNIFWNYKTNTVVPNATTPPAGMARADKIVEDGLNAAHYTGQTGTVFVAGLVYTATIYAKAAERSWIRFGFANEAAASAWFDLSNGVVGSKNANIISHSIAPAGNGWYRCSVVMAVTKTGPYLTVWTSTGDGITNYQGDGVSGVFISGAQAELGSTATTYQRITDFNSDFLAAFPSTTLYLDSAGVTPAAVNGLVGLQLDKSGNLALGADFCVNGGFDTDTTWTKGTGWTISGGVATKAAGTPSTLFQGYAFTPGKFYKITYTLSGRTAGTMGACLLGGTTVAEGLHGSNGTRSCILMAVTGNVTFGITADSTFDGSIDNYTIQELPGNHRYQTTTGSKPVLRGTPVGSNLVTNGDFASGTGWIPNTWVISGGSATATNVVDSLAQNISFTAGNVYRVTFTVTAFSGTGGVRPRFFGGTTVTGATRSATGTYVEYMTAVAGNNQFALASTTTTATITVDNVEIVDVSAGQVTAPYGLQYDGVDDFLQTAAVDFATATSDGLARRNLLTFPSAFDDAVWTKDDLTVTVNSASAPNGTTTADKLIPSAISALHRIRQIGGGTGQFVFSAYVKAAGYNFVKLRFASNWVNFNLSNGTIGLSSGDAGSIQDVGGGWYRCSVGATLASANTAYIQPQPTDDPDIGPIFTGDGTSGVLAWGAQLEAGSTASAFQNIGTDKMFVCAGVRKLSDAFDQATIAELGTNSAAVAGFALQGSPSLTARYRAQLYGTSRAVRDTSPVFAAPDLAVIAILFDIAGATVAEEIIGRRNGSVVFGENTLSPAGSGNFPSAIMYFGRRGGTAFPYNGLDFGMVICGKTLTSTQIANTERWMSYRTGVTL